MPQSAAFGAITKGHFWLWVLTLALFGASAVMVWGNLPPAAGAGRRHPPVGVAFYAFILFTSNPFFKP